jgi:stage II sporulation protein D
MQKINFFLFFLLIIFFIGCFSSRAFTQEDLWGLNSKSDNSTNEYKTIKVSRKKVRVAIYCNVTSSAIVSNSALTFSNGGTKKDISINEEIFFEASDNINRVFVISKLYGRFLTPLPCTLLTQNDSSTIKIQQKPYRGFIIIVPSEHKNCFSIVNLLDVEDYLKGVIPLEIGKGNIDIIEAVKAQAISARTYTYKKILNSLSNSFFDITATIADQVYGGKICETEICNQAIDATKDEVITFKDSLIYAYYHSTCGGKTANIEDVWPNKSHIDYLSSISDLNENGIPYCSISPSFNWEENWPLPQFNYIINRFSKETFPQNYVSGEIKNISIDSRFNCGRIKQLTFYTTTGKFSYSGDKIRFIMRINSQGYPILKSSNISDIFINQGTIFVKGIGYGHGVGMCQMGAIGRAKSGQKYDKILKTYYKNTEIRKVVE